jgi:alkylated DNA repair dioxygenase AlkB
MSHIEQATLFDEERAAQQPGLERAAFATATHHRLDEYSWITHVHGLVTGDGTLMHELSGLAWEQRSRWMYDRKVVEPRLTFEFRELALAPTFLVELTAALSEYCHVPYDAIWMNWYRDHHESTSWHADRPADQPETAVVPVVSLGAARRFLIKDGGPSVAFTPLGGDVLIMHGRCQRDWKHSVPKQKPPAGGRMSLNFNSSAQIQGVLGQYTSRT